jgi:hypothetical protein
MSKWTEDTMYEITMSVENRGLRKQFDEQLKKMRAQPQHQYKTMSEKYEYAYKKVVNK